MALGFCGSRGGVCGAASPACLAAGAMHAAPSVRSATPAYGSRGARRSLLANFGRQSESRAANVPCSRAQVYQGDGGRRCHRRAECAAGPKCQAASRARTIGPSLQHQTPLPRSKCYAPGWNRRSHALTLALLRSSRPRPTHPTQELLQLLRIPRAGPCDDCRTSICRVESATCHDQGQALSIRRRMASWPPADTSAGWLRYP